MSSSTRWDRPWTLIAVVSLVHIATAALFTLVPWPGTDAGLSGLPLDDSWIHLVYARAVSAFDGFAYNPGRPEAGFTSPLWVVMVAPLYWLKSLHDFPVVYGVKLLGLLLGAASSLLAFRLARRLTGLVGAGWTAALLVALDPSLCFAKVSGMEVLLAGTVVLWGLDALLDRRHIDAAIAAALAPLARPELATFTVLVLVVLALRLAQRRAPAWRWLAAASPAALAAGAWVAYCLHVTGRPLPNTFYAKHPVGGFWSNFGDLGTLFGSMLFDLPWFFLGSGLVLFAAGAWVILRPGRRAADRSDQAARLAVVTGPLVLLLGIAWAHNLAQSWPFYWNRYFQPVIPWLLVVVAAGAFELGRGLRGRLRDPDPRRKALGAAVALVLVLPLLVLPLRLVEQAERFSWNCQNINEMQVQLGRWIARNSRPGDWVATNDAGAIRYFGHRAVVDMLGLNNHSAQQRGLGYVLEQTQPRYFVVFPSLFPSMIRSSLFVPVFGIQTTRYTICDCPQELMVVFTTRPEAAPLPADGDRGR